jgi:hypothetical protein
MGFKAISSEPKRHEFLQTLAANWDRIGTLCELVKEPQVRKYLNMCMHNAMNISMKFLNGELSQRDLEDAAREQMMMFNAPAYEFNVLQQRDELVSAA